MAKGEAAKSEQVEDGQAKERRPRAERVGDGQAKGEQAEKVEHRSDRRAVAAIVGALPLVTGGLVGYGLLDSGDEPTERAEVTYEALAPARPASAGSARARLPGPASPRSHRPRPCPGGSRCAYRSACSRS